MSLFIILIIIVRFQ